ncbi:GmrSD restriction endonuclease domain-containing protein [Tessaracoccus flavus]|uniref:GmrSD restriction endonucleases N-terminal domain-containing protein n=1 Tax=Tessaracoccus flavus TaxID=1610493 RepID=A0A1Q2CBZ5_9ACTN|nr:DUF262 domain-containing protein [Tessaracoccus flavus]AQP43565.1 hypothetical protein RPIT_00960 [Tessaracoccus flavus]SDY87230.1 Protein of unknown function DUF262 [Tessaracoccus flavus]
MRVSTILDHIDDGAIALPEFQRGYVWNRDQVRGLFTSLYRGYPVGSFMTWSTAAETAAARGEPTERDGTIKLLLDGQQRATTLYGVIRGRAPRFFEGNDSTFLGLYFNVVEETFEFYARQKMQNSAEWVSVPDLFANPGKYYQQVLTLDTPEARNGQYVTRLAQVTGIGDRDMHVEEVTGADKTIDVVVDIFNRVNSGGTKLSKGDLALAKICAIWPEARHQMNEHLRYWRERGYDFSLDWLLRVVNGIVTGKARFTALADRPIRQVQTGLGLAFTYVNQWLNVIAGHLGLDHARVLFPFPLVVLARHMHNTGGRLPDAFEQARLLYWYIHTGMWGRYAASTETYLAQDLEAVDEAGVDGLIRLLELSRGDLAVRPEDFTGTSMGARFYPTLYMLTRVMKARDLGTGVPISNALLGRLNGLQVHHIFPKAKLYAAGYQRGQVNAIANFCLITQDTNLQVSDADPAVYMPEIESRVPGALASQWVPMDDRLWQIDNYPAFLAARRELLSTAANTLLKRLRSGQLDPAMTGPVPVDAPYPVFVSDDDAADARSEEVDALVEWLTAQGYAEPERDIEIVHPDTGRVLSVAEAAWPHGLQEGLGEKVVLELDEDDFDEDTLAALGYRVFTSIGALREFVERSSSGGLSTMP